MAVDPRVSQVLSKSTKHVLESVECAAQAQQSIQRTALIIDRSRAMISEWRVTGTPALARMASQQSSSKPEAKPAVRPSGVFSAHAQTPLERVSEQDFFGETVRLDGRHFVECNLENCILEYSGGPVVLEGSHFSGCRFQFNGEAAMTVSLLACFGLFGQQETSKVESSSPPVSPPASTRLQ